MALRFAQRAGDGKGSTWAPRYWFGATFGALFAALVRNRFRVSARLVPIVIVDLVSAISNTLHALIERAVFGRRIRDAKLAAPPVFIVGHWRSGTTLLHELLAIDPRHTYLTTYGAFAPAHFLLTERIAPHVKFLCPDRRPMDAMPMEWDAPQEDEFALCNLGVPSPYETISFPNHGPRNAAYLDLTTLSAGAKAAWCAVFDRLMRKLTVRSPKRIVMKSPTHSFRIDTLLAMYPDARFVHLTRDPHAVFASTMHLWRELYASQHLQVPTYEGLEEHVLATYEHLERRVNETRDLVPEGQWHELRFEDLVSEPAARLAELYAELGLGSFEPARAAVDAYLAVRRSIHREKHVATEAQRAAVEQRWVPLARRYGYGAAREDLESSGVRRRTDIAISRAG